MNKMQGTKQERKRRENKEKEMKANKRKKDAMKLRRNEHLKRGARDGSTTKNKDIR
jgi:hypothetical protein